MKKWFFVVLIAGFVGSNIAKPTQVDHHITSSPIYPQKEQVKDFTMKNPTISNNEEGTNLLFFSLEKGMVKKAVLTKMNKDTNVLEVVSLPKKEIEKVFHHTPISITKITKNSHEIKNLEANTGYTIDNTVVFDNSGYEAIFSKLFPNGISLQLTDEMKRDLNLEEIDKEYTVNGKELLSILKALKQTYKYDQEINDMVVKAFSSQLSKPEVLISIAGVIMDIDQYLFTDLSLQEIFSIAMNLISNPVKDVQRLELPINNESVTKINRL